MSVRTEKKKALMRQKRLGERASKAGGAVTSKEPVTKLMTVHLSTMVHNW